LFCQHISSLTFACEHVRALGRLSNPCVSDATNCLLWCCLSLMLPFSYKLNIIVFKRYRYKCQVLLRMIGFGDIFTVPPVCRKLGNFQSSLLNCFNFRFIHFFFVIHLVVPYSTSSLHMNVTRRQATEL